MVSFQAKKWSVFRRKKQLRDQLKDFIIRKHKAETEMLEYEADENKTLTDANKAKYEREKKKYLKDDHV